jgi:DNA-binding transcriptional MocR family regulator
MSNDINATTVVEAQMYFAVIPEWVLDLPISASSVRVYCCLRRYADNKTGQCWPSRRTLAMRAQCSIATLDRAVKELAEYGALIIAKRKNSAGDWTSNLYTVMSLPNGVASKVALPASRIGTTGTPTDGRRTKASMNEKQEQRVYPLEIPKAEPAPTKDGLLAQAQQFRELSETVSPKMRQTMLKLAERFATQAQEIVNETNPTSDSSN